MYFDTSLDLSASSSAPSVDRPDERVVDTLLPVVGRAMRPIVELARAFAAQSETVLVLGPTGAGKSRLARWIHARSGRRDAAFEAVDLMTVPEDMQMAELFGWTRGAFTGAVQDNPGYVARAEGGTLFIDEIDKLSLKAQAGLLAFLETKQRRPLGAATTRVADVRLVIGSNADLAARVRAGEFREDLFYRINVLPLRLPGLDERVDEVGPWSRFMAHRRSEEAGDAPAVLDDAAADLLSKHDWPGNLRQLDNVVRRAYAIAASESPHAITRIRERHVEVALGFDLPQSACCVAPLVAAASAVAAEVHRRHRAGETVGLEVLDGFRGMVLAAATELTADDEETFRMFGRARAVASRNHQRIRRRESERADALSALMGGGRSSSPSA